MYAAVSKSRSFETRLDGSESKVEEWEEQYDAAVNAMSRWTSEQQNVLAMDQVKKFIAEEEALIAAAAA